MTTRSTCTFVGSRGQKLSARLERPEGPALATAVFAHCFTCSKDLKAARRLSTSLAERGFAVLSFDFAGLGSSEGDFVESTFSADVDDLVAAGDYLAETIAPPSLLVGHSLGGAAVPTAASRMPGVQAVATIGAPADVGHVADLFKDDLETIRREGAARVELAGRQFTVSSTFVDDICDQRLLDTVAGLDVSLLLLHAPLDLTVGIDNAAELFMAAKHPKSFVSMDNADHLLTDEADALYAGGVIAAWAARYLPESGPGESSPSDGHGGYDTPGAVATNTSGLVADVVSRGFNLRVDEPVSAGGTETGPTPYDYLGAALASCTSLTLRMYAERKGLVIEEIKTSVTFDQVHADDCADCEHREGRIERFERRVEITGDLDGATRQRLLAIANMCPVHRTLEGQIEVHTTLTNQSGTDQSTVDRANAQ